MFGKHFLGIKHEEYHSVDENWVVIGASIQFNYFRKQQIKDYFNSTDRMAPNFCFHKIFLFEK